MEKRNKLKKSFQLVCHNNDFETLHLRKLASPSRSNCLLNKADTKRSISREDIGNIVGAKIQENDFKLAKDNNGYIEK